MMLFDIFKRSKAKEKPKEPIDIIRDYYSGTQLNTEITTRPNTLDIAIGAMWDHPKDSAWMEKQFKLMNHYSKAAFMASWNQMVFRMRYYVNNSPKELERISKWDKIKQDNLISGYKKAKAFELNILRADNDQSCIVKPIKVCIKEDRITNFGLSIIIENFMVYNNLRFDLMVVGTGRSDPFGGERQLESEVESVSITQEGFSIPYGIEARHGAPFLASLVDNDVREVGIKDSVSTKLYSRSVFPEDRIIDHVQDFDAYSINHITLLKAI